MNMTEKLRYGKGRRIPVILVMIALLFSAFIPAATQSAYAADGTISLKAGSVKAIVYAIAAGGTVAVVVVVCCVLFGAAFYFFGDESSDSYIPVSPEVEAYTSVIEKYCKEYGNIAHFFKPHKVRDESDQ